MPNKPLNIPSSLVDDPLSGTPTAITSLRPDHGRIDLGETPGHLLPGDPRHAQVDHRQIVLSGGEPDQGFLGIGEGIDLMLRPERRGQDRGEGLQRRNRRLAEGLVLLAADPQGAATGQRHLDDGADLLVPEPAFLQASSVDDHGTPGLPGFPYPGIGEPVLVLLARRLLPGQKGPVDAVVTAGGRLLQRDPVDRNAQLPQGSDPLVLQ
jgi:hypothetical protein